VIGVLGKRIFHIVGLDLQLRRRREALHEDRIDPEILRINEREVVRGYPQGEPVRGLLQIPPLVLSERYAKKPLECGYIGDRVAHLPLPVAPDFGGGACVNPPCYLLLIV